MFFLTGFIPLQNSDTSHKISHESFDFSHRLEEVSVSDLSSKPSFKERLERQRVYLGSLIDFVTLHSRKLRYMFKRLEDVEHPNFEARKVKYLKMHEYAKLLHELLERETLRYEKLLDEYNSSV